MSGHDAPDAPANAMDSKERITLRRKEASDDDVVLGILFNGVLDHFKRVLGQQKTDALAAEVLAGESINPLFRYRVALLLDLLGRGLEQRPAGGDDEAFVRDAGRAVIVEALNSPMGKTVNFLSKGHPHKVLEMAATASTSMISYGKRTYEKTGERSGVLGYERELLGPAFFHGLVETILDLMAQTKVRLKATLLNMSGSNFTLHVDW